MLAEKCGKKDYRTCSLFLPPFLPAKCFELSWPFRFGAEVIRQKVLVDCCVVPARHSRQFGFRQPQTRIYQPRKVGEIVPGSSEFQRPAQPNANRMVGQSAAFRQRFECVFVVLFQAPSLPVFGFHRHLLPAEQQ